MDYESESDELNYVIPSDYNPVINCTGLKIEDVFVCLYKNSSPIGLGNMQVSNESFGHEHARQLLVESRWFDYVYGRPMKICFENYPIIDCTVYDEYNFPGMIAINKLKQSCVKIPAEMPFSFNFNQMNFTNQQYGSLVNGSTNGNNLNNFDSSQTEWIQGSLNNIQPMDPMTECENMMKGLHI